MKPMAKHWLISRVGKLSQNLLLLCLVCMEVNYLYLQVHFSLWRRALSLGPCWYLSLFWTAFQRLCDKTHFRCFFSSSLQEAVMYFSLLYYSTHMEICSEHSSEVENLLGLVIHLPDLKLVNGWIQPKTRFPMEMFCLSMRPRETFSNSVFGPALSRGWTRELQKYVPV